MDDIHISQAWADVDKDGGVWVDGTLIFTLPKATREGMKLPGEYEFRLTSHKDYPLDLGANLSIEFFEG